ncbi:MAG TPA: HD domain-containing protein [Candidatus Nanoarchaeia archaeon]
MEINDKVYGTVEITEPVILELLETSPLQRIKKVNQAGTQLVLTHKRVTRWDHCVGVMLLLKKYGACLEEQIAGLLHDVPHTAFSHSADFIFRQGHTQGYHEKFLRKIIFASDIPKILEKYDFNPERIVDEHNFSLLEQELPALCADRIDYSLRDMVRDSVITREQIDQIFKVLTVLDNQFVMTDQEVALMYAHKYMNQCLTSWASPMDLTTYELFGEMVRIAFAQKILVEEDLFLTDEEFLEKLRAAKNKDIQKYLDLMTPNLKIEFNETDYDFDTRGKVRYIDPPIKTKNSIKKLSELNPEFAAEIPKFIAQVKKGYRIKILSS